MNDSIATDRDFAAARSVCRRHAKSFYFASVFLPRAKRDAAYSVYAFCRMMDDAVDEADAEASAEARLDDFMTRIENVYERAPERAEDSVSTQRVLRALSITVQTYSIPRQHFIDLADGCRMDLTITRYATWAELERYCYRVAGVVGLIMSRVFGLSDAGAERQAVAMGNAMQLTNILRDVREDFERGRIYLPSEDLDRFGYRESDLSAGVVNEPFRDLMRFQIERARAMYRDGAMGLGHLADDGSRFTASAMATIYGGILSAIERQQYGVFRRRARLSLPGKLLRLPAARRLARRRAGEPVPDVF